MKTADHPTGKLRFVQRTVETRGVVVGVNVFRVLQQEWEIVEFDHKGNPVGFRLEWRDVPLEVDA